MTSQPLNRPYIGIKMYQDEYRKVEGLLPAPSYITSLQTYNNIQIVLIYVIEGYITSPKQYRWISNVKLGLENYLCVPFTYEENFTINTTPSIIYDIKTLSKAFKAPVIIYPKIMYPSTKKDIYRYLCWYGKRLIHQKCFNKEAMTAAALFMNEKLDDKYQNKELHKKVLGAYMFMLENEEDFKKKLDEKHLKEAHSRGARIKNHNQAHKTQERIDALIKTGDFFKPDGKVNISKLAKAMNKTRKTVAKYV